MREKHARLKAFYAAYNNENFENKKTVCSWIVGLSF